MVLVSSTGSQTSVAAAKTSLNRLKLYVPEMGISSAIVGIRRMSSLVCSLAILDFSSAKAVCTALLILVKWAFVFRYSRRCLNSPAGLQAHWGQISSFLQLYVSFTPSRSGAPGNASWIYFCCSAVDTGYWTVDRQGGKRKVREEKKEITLVVPNDFLGSYIGHKS